MREKIPGFLNQVSFDVEMLILAVRLSRLRKGVYLMVKWERIGSNKVLMEIEVPAGEVDVALDKSYRKMVRKVDFPGFRKGKVPRSLLETKLGPEILYDGALEILAPLIYETYDKAVKKIALEPIDKPDMDLMQMEKGKPLLFKVEVEVMPEVILSDYKGISIEKEEKEISDADVEESLARIQKQHARLIAIEDETAEAVKGDVVIIDFKGYVEGEPFPGGESEGYSLELGSDTFVSGFEKQLEGVKINEERQVKVTFPIDYRAKDLAGKEVVFEVKLKEIKRKELPDLDANFAQEVSDFDTIEEFREDIRNKLKENEKTRAQREMEEKLIQKISDETEVEIPETLISRELHRIDEDTKKFLHMQGLTMEQYLNILVKSSQEIEDENRAEAISRLRRNLTLDAIGKKEGIIATESEVDKRVEEIAARQKKKFAEMKEILDMQGQLKMFTDEIRFRKIIDFLVQEAVISNSVIQ